MAKHDVFFELPESQLGKADAVFKIKQNGKLLGTLAISNGSIVWFSKKTTYGCKMNWGKFDDVMYNEAVAYEKRKKKR